MTEARQAPYMEVAGQLGVISMIFLLALNYIPYPLPCLHLGSPVLL